MIPCEFPYMCYQKMNNSKGPLVATASCPILRWDNCSWIRNKNILYILYRHKIEGKLKAWNRSKIVNEIIRILKDKTKKKSYPVGHIMNCASKSLIFTGSCNDSFKNHSCRGGKPKNDIAWHFAKMIFYAGLMQK